MTACDHIESTSESSSSEDKASSSFQMQTARKLTGQGLVQKQIHKKVV